MNLCCLNDWLKKSCERLSFQECVYLARAVLDVQDLGVQLTSLEQKFLDKALEQRIAGMPLAKIIMRKCFWDSVFITTQHTLDPRPETEGIIENISIKPRSLLELGCGTGCVILSILQLYPKCSGIAVDISLEALQVARLNAEILEVNKVIFMQNNWACAMQGHFDLIVSNPPYVEVANDSIKHDPAIALFGNEKTYAAIFASLCDVTFCEFLLEIPENLINSVKPMVAHLPHKFLEIGNEIFVLKICDSVASCDVSVERHIASPRRLKF